MHGLATIHNVTDDDDDGRNTVPIARQMQVTELVFPDRLAYINQQTLGN